MRMLFQLKQGVSLKGVSPQLQVGMMVALTVYFDERVPFVVTSVTDSVHSAGSLHYAGAAFDARLPSRYADDTSIDRRVTELLQDSLGEEWDVVLEADHIHVEWQPKPKVKET